MTRRVLITGGAGFIGSHTADALIADGWTVEIIDDLSSGKRQNIPSSATFHQLDIRSPEAATVVASGAFDAVVHLAAQMDVRRSVADPLFDADVNVRGTLNLLEAARSLATRPRFVFASTGGAVYGDHTRPPNSETTPKEPDSPYAVSKLAAEHYLAFYSRIQGYETIALRFANVYGPRQDPHGEAGVVAIFCSRLLAGQPLTVFGDGLQTRDYVHVGDVAAAVIRALNVTLDTPPRIDARAFNIGTGIATSVLDLASGLQRAAGNSSPLQFAPKRAGEQQDSVVDIDKARRELQWSPRVALEDGLRDTFAWFAARAKHAALTS
jgi:UDP-glucose 4-epimerase